MEQEVYGTRLWVTGLLAAALMLVAARTFAVESPALSDSAAFAMVTYSSFEPRPGNYSANHTTVRGSDLVTYVADAALSFLLLGGNALLRWVDGQFTGTTDEILQWGAHKWGFDPDLVRAIAANESWWHQSETGASYGILQIQLSSFPASFHCHRNRPPLTSISSLPTSVRA
jgi:hypothetical protein